MNKKKKQAFEKIKSILKHGDIIITQDKGWKAKIIGKVCKTGGLGIWNHAMIVIYHPKATHPTDEDLVIMEALSEGVSLTPIDKAFKRCKYWEIERVNPGYVTSKDYIQTIAMRYHCVPYAWAQLFGDIFLLWLRGISGKRAYKMLSEKDKYKGVICTELVGAIYRLCGYPIKTTNRWLEGRQRSDGYDVPDQYLAPQDFRDSLLLDPIYTYNVPKKWS